MSIIDKAFAAITLPESEVARIRAAAEARELAGRGDWLAQLQDHHDPIRQAFAPSSRASVDKQEHLEGAVLHHMFEEESDWFRDLKTGSEHQARLAERYPEEFNRYRGSVWRGACSTAPTAAMRSTLR